MKKAFFLVTVFALILFFSFLRSSHAIYQWVDEKGQLHITDYPKPAQEKEEKTSPGRQTGVTAPDPAVQDAKQPARVQPQPQPSPVVQPPTDTRVKKPLEPAPMMPARQAGKESTPPAEKSARPVPSLPYTAAPSGTGGHPSGMPAFPMTGAIPDAKMLTALLAGFMTVFLFLFAGLYLYSSLCLFLIAKKLDVPGAWTAWIPILQVWAFFGSAGKSLWWILLFFIPIVNAIVGIYLWMCITENCGRNKWLGLLMLIPVVSLIFLGVLAFSKKEDASVSGTAVA